MNDLQDRLAKLREGWVETPLDVYQPRNGLDQPQFTADDVVKATGITASQLHNWTTRDWGFRFAMGNPGKGRRRLFSALDIVTLQIADYLAPLGLVQVAAQWSRGAWTNGRVLRLFSDETVSVGLVYRLVLVRSPDKATGDWYYVLEGTQDEHRTGPTYIRLELDRLIIETLENLACIMDGLPLPGRDLLRWKSPQETRAEIDAQFGAADVDEQGRSVKTGLTFDESAELDALEERHAAAQAHDYETGPFHGGNTREQDARRSELLTRHWDASRAKLAAEHSAARDAVGK